jgi:hypothetical protein
MMDVIRTGTADGIYSSTAGLVINPTTGEIDLAASTPGFYVVTYAFSEGTCSNTTSTNIVLSSLSAGGVATPESGAVCPGTGTIITLSGQGGPIVEWQSSTDGVNWTDIVSIANSLSTGSLAQKTEYRAVVDIGGCANFYSTVAVVDLNAPLAATPLNDQAVYPGDTVSFTTTASGTGPFNFVWMQGTTVLTSGGRYTINTAIGVSTLSIANVNAADAGSYSVIVTGACGPVTESAALTLNSPVATTSLTDQPVCAGSSATFATTASGTGPQFRLETRHNLDQRRRQIQH